MPTGGTRVTEAAAAEATLSAMGWLQPVPAGWRLVVLLEVIGIIGLSRLLSGDDGSLRRPWGRLIRRAG